LEQNPSWSFSPPVDLIFCYGVYYHLNENLDFPIMRRFSKWGKMIVLDYLQKDDTTESYGYDNPSTSISQFGLRPREETLLEALKNIWGYSYLPKNPLNWIDPERGSNEDRRVAAASHSLIDNPNLIPQ